MYYGSTKLATGWKKEQLNSLWVRIIYSVLFFIPKANPDNEKKLHLVRKWVLEVNDNGEAQREIALGENDVPLFSSPNDRNFGIWTDTSDTITKSELEPMDRDSFEKLWQELNKNA